MPSWLNRAGDQAVVVWQSSQVFGDWMCRGPLPVAVVPLWQEKQAPITSAWSTRVAGLQAVVA